MSDFRVILQPEAERNIATIQDWIDERSPPGALRWYQALQEAVDSLRSNPDRCPVAPESRHFQHVVRHLTFRMRSRRTYRILFTIVNSEVHVLYVRGPGQDWITP
jgi:plasmid stabilization system protein ParE